MVHRDNALAVTRVQYQAEHLAGQNGYRTARNGKLLQLAKAAVRNQVRPFHRFQDRRVRTHHPVVRRPAEVHPGRRVLTQFRRLFPTLQARRAGHRIRRRVHLQVLHRVDPLQVHLHPVRRAHRPNHPAVPDPQDRLAIQRPVDPKALLPFTKQMFDVKTDG